MQVEIQCRAEALNEGDGAALRIPDSAEFTRAAEQGFKNCSNEDAQDVRDQTRVVGQAVTQCMGKRQHPLAHRNSWEHAVDEVRCSIRHTSGSTRIAKTPFLAGERNNAVQTTCIAMDPNEASCEHPTP
jgi:hypothetical protein